MIARVSSHVGALCNFSTSTFCIRKVEQRKQFFQSEAREMYQVERVEDHGYTSQWQNVNDTKPQNDSKDHKLVKLMQ